MPPDVGKYPTILPLYKAEQPLVIEIQPKANFFAEHVHGNHLIGVYLSFVDTQIEHFGPLHGSSLLACRFRPETL